MHKKDYDPFRTPPLWEESKPQSPREPSQDSGDADDDENHDRQGKASGHRPDCPIRDFAEPLPNSSHPETSMWKALLDLLVSLLNGGPNDNRAARIITTLAVMALIGFTAAALGKFQVFGFTGFAYASDVKEIRIDQLDQKIENAVKDHCLADTQKSKSYYYEKLAKLKLKYREIDPLYIPPLCRDLGVPEIQVMTSHP